MSNAKEKLFKWTFYIILPMIAWAVLIGLAVIAGEIIVEQDQDSYVPALFGTVIFIAGAIFFVKWFGGEKSKR